MVPTVEPTDDCWIAVLRDRRRTRRSPRDKNRWAREGEGAWGQKEHTLLDENPKDLEKVLLAVSGTREEEIGCDECFERLDRFVEIELSGLDAPTAIPQVEDHLRKCGDCREEFEALLEALRAEEGPGPVGRLWARLRRSLGSNWGSGFLPEEKRGMTMRTFGLPEGEAQHRRARHRQLPHLRRLRAEEIRAVVNFDENLARWAQCSRLPPAKVGRHVDEAGRTVVAILLHRREVAMEGSTSGAEGNTGVTD